MQLSWSIASGGSHDLLSRFSIISSIFWLQSFIDVILFQTSGSFLTSLSVQNILFIKNLRIMWFIMANNSSSGLLSVDNFCNNEMPSVHQLYQSKDIRIKIFPLNN